MVLPFFSKSVKWQSPMGMLKKIKIAFSLIILTVLASGGLLLFANYAANSIPSSSNITTYTYRIVATYPHDPSAFTEGLAFANGFLYEGTGLYGQSSLRQVALENGSVLKINQLADEYFGEGVTIIGARIIQLTWRSHIGFVYDLDNFTLLGNFSYSTEGWGLTNDGSRLIMSDGTATFRFLDPVTFATLGQIEVHDDHGPVTQLNELEYIHGEIFANIWQTNRIAQISPQTGQVVGWIDLTGLLNLTEPHQPVDVLNGIAYDDVHDWLFVTGKLWPSLFEIELKLQE